MQAIVGHRQYNGKLVYKIRWKGYDPVHDTWENHDSLSCPDLLEMYNAKVFGGILSQLVQQLDIILAQHWDPEKEKQVNQAQAGSSER